MQAALCCDRLPLKCPSIEAFVKWNKFREEWGLKTECSLQIPDDLTFMRFPFHWLQSEAEIEYKKRQQVIGTRVQGDESGVGGLISNEGLDFDYTDLEDARTDGPKVETKASEDELDLDPHSPFQRGSRCLWLLVRYKGQEHWQFPVVDHVPQESMRETLQKLCFNHFGPFMSPYLVGMTPMAMLKERAEVRGLKGSKTFFYRSHWIPESEVHLPDDGPVEDYRFVTREELKELLPAPSWRSVRYGIPLE